MKKTSIAQSLQRFMVLVCLLLGASLSHAVPLFWDINGSTAGAGGSSPSGTWNGQNNFWTSASNGSGTPGLWSGATAIFSAGNDAGGSYLITVGTPQSADTIIVEDGFVTIGGTSALTLTGNATIDVQPGRSLLVKAPIEGTAGLKKTGDGILGIERANTYSGATMVNQGLLMVMNGTGSATGSGNLVIAATAALKGTGVISGTVTLNGIISPGTSPGTITTGSEVWGPNAGYQWEINDAYGDSGTSPGWDLININGSLTINANSSNRFNLNLNTINAGGNPSSLQNFTNTDAYQWTIVTTTAGITNFSADKFNINTAGFADSLGSGVFRLALSGDGKDLILYFTHVPTIDGQPASSQTKSSGDTVFFNVTASGAGPLTYQWKKDGATMVDGGRVSGAASSSLSISSLTTPDAGSYTVEVSNLAGTVTSSPSILNLLSAPQIVAQPMSKTNNAGTTNLFAVGATGGNLNYQWKKGNTLLADGTKYMGAKSSALLVKNLLIADAGSFTVVITNTFGSITSAVAKLSVLDPAINGQPKPADRMLGANVTFSVQAAGTGTLLYQWQKDGVNLSNVAGHISGATAKDLTIIGVTLPDYGVYRVLVQNSRGTVTSLNAPLSPSQAPTITFQPQSSTNPPGGSVSFNVGGSGTQPFGYQWTKDGENLENSLNVNGVNGSTLNLSSLTVGDAGEYAVTISNEVGTVTSTSAFLTVSNLPPTVSIVSPADGTSVPGPANVMIMANAFDQDGSINRVEFYANDQLIGTSYTPPYTNGGSNIAGGIYTTYAKAFDNLGESTTSESITFTVAGDCSLAPNGMVSWWGADRDFAANDYLGRNDGVLVSGADTNEFGLVGGGYKFDGVSEVLVVPHSPTLSFSNRMSIELWAYRTGTSPVGRLIGKRASGCGAYNYELSYDETVQGNGLRFGGDSGGGFSGVIVPNTLPTNEWTHIAGTYDGTTFRLYVDGLLVGSANGSLGTTNSDALKIGGSGGCDYFLGTLDEITIYNRALSGPEIQQVYGAGSFGKCESSIKLETVATFGGPGNQRGTDVAIAGGAAYLSGYSLGGLVVVDTGGGFSKGLRDTVASRLTGANDEGIIARFNLPLGTNGINGITPAWKTNWPNMPDVDRFNSVAVSGEGVYVAGESYERTLDVRGEKEGKGMVVKFPFAGAIGAGFGGSTWDKQTPASPGAFGLSGNEVINATVVNVEGGITYIYAAGHGQANSGNIGRQFLTKMRSDSTIMWTVRDDSATSTAFSSGRAVTVMNGNIYVAGVSDDAQGQSIAVVSKYNLNGNLQWVLGRDPGTFNGIAAHGGAIYTVGESGTSQFIEKRDEAGTVIWSVTSEESAYPEGLNAVTGFGNRIYAAGWSVKFSENDKEAVLLEISPEDGEILNVERFASLAESGDSEATGIATDGTDLYVSGETQTPFSGRDAILLRYRVSQQAVPLLIASTLPNGEVGKPYVANLQATGGKPPYTWSVVSGTLPSGLSFSSNGSIFGTPTIDGVSSVTLKVQDSSSPQEAVSSLFNVVIIESNDVPVVTISSPSQGQTFGSPASIGVSVTVADGDTISRVEVAIGSYRQTLIASPYTATFYGVGPGTYLVTASAQDVHGAVGVAAPRFVRVNAPGTYVIDFESLDTTSAAATGSAVTGYFTSHGVGVTNETSGSSFIVNSETRVGGGNAILASSGRNIFTQGGINGRASYTIRFGQPIGRFEFTRVSLLSGLRGVTHPAWRATAYDASGNELSSVNEDLITSYSIVPSSTFNLYGPDIAWVRVEGDNRGVASFTSALLDDLILHDDVGNVPPSISITSPLADENFTAPANVTVTATASDSDGSVASISVYRDNILVGTTTGNPGSVTLLNLSPGVYFVKAVATDDQGASRSSQLRRFVVNAAAGINMINFDALDASARNIGGSTLSNYLAGYGVSIAGPTLGSRVEAADFRNLAGGDLVSPPSPRNVLGQLGVSGPMAFTLRFGTSLQSVKFTRPLLKSSVAGVTHPAWTARAFNLSGVELATVSEDEINSFTEVASRTFELRATGIAWVRFESEGGGTTFSSLLIDDLVLNANALISTLSVNITSPAQNAVFTAPSDILVHANVVSNAAIAQVEFYAGTTLIGVVTEAPFEFNWENVLAGNYGLRAKVYDADGNAVWSSTVNIVVNPGAAGDSTIVNFDAINANGGPVSGATLATYLSGFGITLSEQSLGTTVQAVAQTSFLNGNTVQAASEPNVLTQTGPSDSMDFTLSFAEPLQSLQFTRPKLRAGAIGITHPQWTARAYDATDTELTSVSESFTSSYSDVGSAVFVLQGQGITKVRFESNNRRATAFKAVLLDDFILTTVTTNLPPVVIITEPGSGSLYAAPALINVVADAFDHDGEVVRVDFYNGATLIESVTEEPYSIVWTNVPVGRFSLRAVAIDNLEVSRSSDIVRVSVEPRDDVFGFLTQPEDQTVALGSNATFSATTTFSSAVPPVTYQWTFNGDNIEGATESNLELTAVAAENEGSYTLLASLGTTNITSESAILTVAAAPIIDTQPQGQSIDLGSSATFSVSATGAAPLRYQWVRNGNPIPGATTSTLVLTTVKSTDAGNYGVVVANSIGAVRSDKANLSVSIGNGALSTADDFADRITFNPLVSPVFGDNSSATSESGEPDHAGKTGGKSIWYTWNASFTGVITLTTLGSSFDTLMAVYTGDDVASLSQVIANDDARDGYFASQVTFYVIEGIDYHIAVDGFYGASGNVTLSMPDGGYRVLDVNGSDEELPNITVQPASRSVVEGTNHTLTVSVTSQTALNYQWFFNGLPVLNETNSTLELVDFDSGSVGRYYVLVANDVGSVESDVVQLQIISAAVENAETVSSKDKFFESIASGVTASAGRAHKVPQGEAGPSRGYTTTQILSTVGSTKEEGEQNHAGETGGASEWYVYAAPESATIHINTDGSSFNTVLAVYTGSGFGFDTLTTVASSNNSSGNGGDRVRFAATQDTIYFIAVDGVGGASGTVNLNIHLGTPPSITVNPLTKVVTLGSSALFSVTATGTTNLNYQWKFNGANIGGATASSYTRSNIQLTHFGAYTVVVSNIINTASNSPSAFLQIESAPIITTQPTNRTVVAGTNTTLSVRVVGTDPMTYRWLFNDVLISGATSSNLVLTAIQTTNIGSYKAIVTNIVGAVTSQVAVVTVTVPAPVVTSHAENVVVTDGSIVLAGTVAGNARVTQVQTKLDNGAFTAATGTTSWSKNLTLVPGTNTITVKAIDASVFESTTVRKVFFASLRAFTLQTNGIGSITNAATLFNNVTYRATNGAQLIVGKTYKLTASQSKTGPGTNYIFTNWTDHANAVIETNAILNYVMDTNAHVKANFIPNPFIGTAGIYSGLFFEAGGINHSSAGYVLIKANSKLAYSGKLFLDGNALSISGKFALPGTATKTVARLAKYGKPDLTLSFALDFSNGSDQILGTLAQGSDWVAELQADRSVWATNRVADAFTNNYVIVIPPTQANPALGPVGYGYGLVSVDRLGKVKIAGGAADTALLKQGTILSKSGLIPFYAPLYLKERTFGLQLLKEHQGSAMGWLALIPNAAAGKTNLAPQGTISWIKTGWTNAFYPNGFTNEVVVLGSRQSLTNGLRMLSRTSGTATADDGNLLSPITVGFSLATNNVFTTNTANPQSLKFAAVAKTGAWKGTFVHPQNPAVLTRYFGAFLQDYNYGRGYFGGTNQTGSIKFE